MSGAPLLAPAAYHGVRLLKWRIAVAAWIGVIFFSSTNLAQQWAEAFWQLLSAQSSVSHPQHSIFYLLLDKGFHVSMFFVLALLLCRTLPESRRQDFAVIICGSVVGSCSEFLQRFFPGRDPALRDVFINISGTVLGLIAWRIFFPRLNRFTLKQ